MYSMNVFCFLVYLLQINRNEDNLANIIKISGCRDTQTSADAFINGKYQGALTFSFLKTTSKLTEPFPKGTVEPLNNLSLI